MTYHQLLTKALNDVTTSRFLVVRCNGIDERSAVNRMAYHANLCTMAINFRDFRENYIYKLNGRLICAAVLPWMHNDQEDFDYYDDDFEDGCVLYYDCPHEREDAVKWDQRVSDLDYNAVVIYPKNVRLQYGARDEFLRKKKQVTRHHTRRNKGSPINTIERETSVINAIYSPRMAYCAPSECDLIVIEIRDPNTI